MNLVQFFIFLLLLLNFCFKVDSFEVNFRADSSLIAAVEILIETIRVKGSKSISVILPDASNDPFKLNDLVAELLKKNQKKIEAKAFRVEATSKITIMESRRRSLNIFLIKSLAAFIKVSEKITDNRFRMKGYFVFLLLNGGFNGYHKIFEFMWSIKAYNVVVMFEDKNREVRVETFIPFNSKKCFDTSPVVVNKFINGSFIKDIQSIFPNDMKNLFNCPIRVATSNSSEPYVFVRKVNNDTINLSGRDIEFIESISKVMKFKINFMIVDEGFFNENGTSKGPLRKLLDKEVDFVIADFWLKKNRVKYFDATDSYISDFLVFVIPPGTGYGPFEKFLLPLNPGTWTLVLIFFLIACLAIFYIRRRSQVTQDFVFGRNIRHPYMNMLTAFVGGTQKRLPTRNFARFLLMSFLLYSLVIRTAYQGAYYGFLKSNQQHDLPDTIDQMIDKDFRFYLFDWMVDLLKETEKVISRATVVQTSEK